MRSEMNGHEGSFEQAGRAPARAPATHVLGRWRAQGFDTVLCYPSGYCGPANSSAFRAGLREGYCLHAIESEEAVTAVAIAIGAGAAYRAWARA